MSEHSDFCLKLKLIKFDRTLVSVLAGFVWMIVIAAVVTWGRGPLKVTVLDGVLDLWELKIEIP